MLLNYFKLAIRLLIRNPFFTLINVIGLSIGYTVFFILWQYSENELRSDQFHKDFERIYRLTWLDKAAIGQGTIGESVITGTTAALLPLLVEDIPEVAIGLRISTQTYFSPRFTGDHDKEIYFSYTDVDEIRRSFLEHEVIYADTNLFNFFTIPLIRGNANQALKEQNAVVLSEKLAHKYFGSRDPMGAIIMLNDSIPLVVNGVFKNLPANSHLNFEAVISMLRIQKNLEEITFSREAFFHSYLKVHPGSEVDKVQQKVFTASKAYCRKEFERWNWNIDNYVPILQPLKNVPFETFRSDDLAPKSKFILTIFQWAGIVILVMAWINYINLTISNNHKRFKEIGARTAVGAGRKHFFSQFMIEASLINFLSLLLAVTLYQLFKIPAEILFGFNLEGSWDAPFSTLLMIALFCFCGMFITGFYPALITLGQLPGKLFATSKRKFQNNLLGGWLTICQFVVAVILVVWIFGVSGQINHVINKNLGFTRDAVIVIDLPFLRSSAFENRLDAFVNEVSAFPQVEDYAVSSSVPGDDDRNGIGLQRNEASQFLGVGTNGGVDNHFIPFFSLNLLAGRNFRWNYPADRNSIIVSTIVLQRLGISNPADGVGKRVFIEQGAWSHKMVPCEIIGVIEDYGRQPLFSVEKVQWPNSDGVALTYGNHLELENVHKKISLKLKMTGFQSTIEKIKSAYKSSFRSSLFNWYFLDDYINRHYQSEKIVNNQILLFTFIAIAIACLGLLGMMSCKVAARTKEIGIRKVLGADLRHIAHILLDSTLKQVVIASLVGIPLSFYLTQQYLEKFSDRIQLQWWHFALPVAILLTIMFATIASVLWKTARSNPVEALRYE
jgi:putative ABC transport system permease protein